LGTLGLPLFLFASFATLQYSRAEDLQPYLTTVMRGHRGAAIVANPATGQILAVWNSSEAFDKAFPPGSTAKLVASTAALEEGVISPTEKNFCRRTPELLGDAYHCSHPPPHAPYTLVEDIANSCNYFFSALSLRLSTVQLAHWYAVFGFGAPVEGVSSATNVGLARVGASPQEKALATLGEKTILVTPAQLLQAYCAIANRGPVYRLWKRGLAGSGQTRIVRNVKLSAQTFDLLSSAFVMGVQSGTGQEAGVPGIHVAGKTGTATNMLGLKTTHAWFVGYAPAEKPEIILVIFLERGTGAHDAAPLAGKIFRHQFQREGRKK
jgi:cell division protein FtsI/penicillin-binding protein 2